MSSKTKSRYICNLPECIEDKVPCIKEDKEEQYEDSDCSVYISLLQEGKTHKNCEHRVLRGKK